VPTSISLRVLKNMDHGKDSLCEFTQKPPRHGVRAATSAAARRAAAVSPAEDAAATEENAALVHRFVPEAMRDAGTGTLIAQQSCGTIDRPERGPSKSFLEPCRKCWFVGRLRCTPETAAAFGSPSYKQPPVTATAV